MDQGGEEEGLGGRGLVWEWAASLEHLEWKERLHSVLRFPGKEGRSGGREGGRERHWAIGFAELINTKIVLWGNPGAVGTERAVSCAPLHLQDRCPLCKKPSTVAITGCPREFYSKEEFSRGGQSLIAVFNIIDVWELFSFFNSANSLTIVKPEKTLKVTKSSMIQMNTSFFRSFHLCITHVAILIFLNIHFNTFPVSLFWR